MTTLDNPKEKRAQARKGKLGTNNPVCVTCGENKWECMELHHIAGKAYGDDLCTVCRNCHRVLSDDQIDHPKPVGKPPATLEIIGHFLVSVADLFALMVEKFREFGRALIEMSRATVQTS